MKENGMKENGIKENKIKMSVLTDNQLVVDRPVEIFVTKESDNSIVIYDKDTCLELCKAKDGSQIFDGTDYLAVKMTAEFKSDGANYEISFEKSNIKGMKYIEFLAAKNGYYVNPNTVIHPVSQEGKNIHGLNKQDILKEKYDKDEKIVNVYIVYMEKTKSACVTIKVGDNNWQDVGFLPADLYDKFKGEEIKHMTGFIIQQNGQYKIIIDMPIKPSSKEYAIMKRRFTIGLIDEMPIYDARAYYEYNMKNNPIVE